MNITVTKLTNNDNNNENDGMEKKWLKGIEP